MAEQIEPLAGVTALRRRLANGKDRPGALWTQPAVGLMGREGAHSGADQQLLIAALGARSVAVPVASVERILPMAALTSLPSARRDIVGVLNVSGAVLPVVDARPRLGQPTPPWRPEQLLVLVAAATRYLLWLDQVEEIVWAPADRISRVDLGAEPAPTVVRWGDRVLPVLSPEALDPGPIVQHLRT